jgi:hypothetical protein
LSACDFGHVGRVNLEMKYCPLCDANYSDAHDRCTICGAELVPTSLRGRPTNEKERRERLELVWKSGDPVAVSLAIASLREAGIRHHVQSTENHLVFELGMPRPKYEIRVLASDVPAARQLLDGISESLPFAIGEDSPAAEIEESAGPNESRAGRLPWKPALATCELWSGDDAALEGVLEDCLRENHIGFRREEAAPGTLRLFVMPGDESAAREILREITEGTPQQ